MPDLNPYFSAIATGSTVSDITGYSRDGFTAGAYGAFIESITGRQPDIVEQDGRAVMMLDSEQVSLFQRWLDRQVLSTLERKEPGRVIYELGPVFKPWAVKRALPVGIALFLSGVIVSYLVTR
jgi:hypothetical protein